MKSGEAVEYAKIHGPSNETRKNACGNPYSAYYYAEDVDKCPREDTPKSRMQNPESAYWYALCR